MEKRKSLIWQVPFLLMLIVGTVLIIWQQRNMPYRKCEGPIFGTYYHVTYQSDKDMQNEITDALNRVDASLSPSPQWKRFILWKAKASSNFLIKSTVKKKRQVSKRKPRHLKAG